jgi:hypothetical protein
MVPRAKLKSVVVVVVVVVVRVCENRVLRGIFGPNGPPNLSSSGLFPRR